MTAPRCPELIAAGRGAYARCHRPPGHQLPCHAAGRTWHTGNQRQVLWHLLVLVIDWTRHGAPRELGITMRQFTPWAEAIGGFLAHHGIKGFLGNIENVRDIDDDNALWTAFLAKWQSLHGDKRLTTNELRGDAEPTAAAGLVIDKWDGLFLTDARGKIPSQVSLGKRLTGHIDRYHGSYVLRSDLDRHSKVRTWWVEEYSEVEEQSR